MRATHNAEHRNRPKPSQRPSDLAKLVRVDRVPKPARPDFTVRPYGRCGPLDPDRASVAGVNCGFFS
ncbi:MAG: hypothetical protein H6810_12995 [Phycisphaeraceae bacterium]|nr:MAG: hypothetical protein H6810_12995 [Phycisphaeraceae bacterium]